MNGFESLLAGRTLVERYAIEEVIGRGGMGAVYRARDTRLERAVAVKVIAAAPTTPAAAASLRARFHREARAAAGIRHPNVVAVHDFGTDTELGLDFLIMELLRGEDLASRLARTGRPPTDLALHILLQAARGLAAGHRAGLVHRDVKPGNLFLEPGEAPGEVEVRVLDFGIVELLADDELTSTQLTRFGSAPCSPAYASPEQLRGDPRLSPSSDVFSLGAVGYHLLAGERAFASTEPREMAGQLSVALASLHARTPELSPPIRATLARALSQDPAARFPDAAAFVDALAAARGNQTASPSRPAPRREPARGVPDERTRWLAPDPAPSPGAWPPHSPSEGPRGAPPAFIPEGGAPGRPRGGGFLRMVGRIWDLSITAVALALAAGMWWLTISGAMGAEQWTAYGGAVGSMVFTPLAVVRAWGSRWRYPLALLASIAASVGAVALVGFEGDPRHLLGAVLGSQLLVSAAVAGIWRTRSRAADPLPRR